MGKVSVALEHCFLKINPIFDNRDSISHFNSKTLANVICEKVDNVHREHGALQNISPWKIKGLMLREVYYHKIRGLRRDIRRDLR